MTGAVATPPAAPGTTPAGGRLVDVGDTELFVHEIGDGVPLLALHGGLGLDHSYLRPWLDGLAGVARVVYYDHRGNGRSPAGRPLALVDMATWADDLDALRAALGFDRVVVLAHSYGGFVALEHALRHPGRAAGLILCGTAAACDHWPTVHDNLDRRRATPEQRRGFRGEPFTSDEELAGWLRAAAPLYLRPGADPALLDLGSVRFRVDALARGGECLAGWDRRADLGRIAAPALVLTGRHDFIMPFEVAGAPLAAGLPSATSVVFEESGHLPFVEEPGRFERVVRSWLRGLRM